MVDKSGVFYVKASRFELFLNSDSSLLNLPSILDIITGKQCMWRATYGKTAASGKTGNRCFQLVGQHPNLFETGCVGLRLCEPFRKMTSRFKRSFHTISFLGQYRIMQQEQMPRENGF